jgi:hypothetical protein
MRLQQSDFRALDDAEIDAIAGGISGHTTQLPFGMSVTVWDNGTIAVEDSKGCVTTSNPKYGKVKYCPS